MLACLPDRRYKRLSLVLTALLAQKRCHQRQVTEYGYMLVCHLRGDGQGAFKDNTGAQHNQISGYDSELRSAKLNEQDTSAQDVVNWRCTLDQVGCDADTSKLAFKQQDCAVCEGPGSSQTRAPPCGSNTQLLLQSYSRPQSDPGAAAAAISAAQHMTGCSSCCTHHGRSWQDEAGAAGVVEQLAAGLAGQQGAAALQTPGSTQPLGSQKPLSDALQALFFVCCEHAGNAQRLLQAGGLELLLKQSAAGAVGADALPLWCIMVGITAAAPAAMADSKLLQEQLDASLLALKDMAQQQASSTADASGSSVHQQLSAVLWAISKVAGQIAQQGGHLSSSSSSNCQQMLGGTLTGVVLPCLASAVNAEGGVACDVNRAAQQQQWKLWLMQQCVACCAVLASAGVAEQCKKQLVELLHTTVKRAMQMASSNVSGVCKLATQVHQSAEALLQRLAQSGCTVYDAATADTSGQLCLQRMPMLVQQVPACRLLAALQLEQGRRSSSSGCAAEPLVQAVVAGATATIEVVSAGSHAGKDSCDEKDSTPSSKGRCSEHSDDTSFVGQRDSPALLRVQGQQVDLPGAAVDGQQQDQQHPNGSAADLLPANPSVSPVAHQPSQQQLLQSYPLVLDPFEQDSIAGLCNIPHRSSSSCSIKACGDGRTDNGSSSYGSGSNNGDGSSSGNDGAGEAGGSGDGGSGAGGSGSHGTPGGSGSGGSSGGDDDRKGNSNKQHHTESTEADSNNSVAGSSEGSSSSPPTASAGAEADAEQGAAATAVSAVTGVGCSASDPVVVPAPASLGTCQGLRLYGSPASLLSASAAAEVQRRASESGALHGGSMGSAGLMGTSFPGTAQLPGLLDSAGPRRTPGTPGGGNLGTLAGSSNAASGPGFTFPASLSQLSLPLQPHLGTGGSSLAEALLSPLSLAAHGLQQQAGIGCLGDLPPASPAGFGTGFPGFSVASSPPAGAAGAVAAYRRASESSGFGGPASRYSSGWGATRTPTQQQQQLPMQQLALQQQQHGGGVLPGSWPDAAPGAGLTAVEQHLRQLQLQQHQQQGLATAPDAGLPPFLPPSAGGPPVHPAAATAGRPPCPAASPALLSPAASGGHHSALGSIGSGGSSSMAMPLERRALSGHLSSHLHLLNPGLMGLIGSSDPNLGAIGSQLSASDHLMTWLSNDEYTRGSAIGISSSGGTSSESAAAAVVELDAAAMAAPSSSTTAAAVAQQCQGSTPADVDSQYQQGTDGRTVSDAVPTADAIQPRTRDQGLPPTATPPGHKAAESSTGRGTATAAVDTGVKDGATGSASAAGSAASMSSGCSMSRAGSMGSAAGSMAHSYSGDSLGSDADLEAMRLSSASFAAALAEAEAIAANVAASMARQQQLQQNKAGVKADQAVKVLEVESASDLDAGRDCASSPTLDAADGTAYDPAELTKGQPSRHLWLGNLHQRLPRSVLRGVFERYGPVDDVVTFPGRMYAFVNFKEPADAAKAAEAVQDKEVPVLSGTRRLVVKFRSSRRALGKVAEAMVPGLVDPGRSGSTSSNAGSSTSSMSGSQSNLEAAAAAPSAATMHGLPAAASRNSSSSGLAWLAAAAVTGGATMAPAAAESEGVGPAAAAPATSSARVGSLAGASTGSLTGEEQQQQQQLPPGLSAATAVAAATGSIESYGAPDTTAAQNQCLASSSSGSLSAAAAAVGSSSLSSAAAAAAAVAAAAAAVANSSTDSNAATAAHVAAAAAALAAVDAGLPQGPTVGSAESSGMDDGDIPEGKPSRHLWLGNIPLKPNRAAMEALFSRFGPLESVRVFPGKTFAFVNFVHAAHAIQAKAALDAQPSPHITGPKPLVIRFQKDTAAVPLPGNAARVLDLAAARARKVAVPWTSLTGGLLGSSATGSLGALGMDEELMPEPAVNLSNKLNPNNIHYDRELAARYKRMTKIEKEALWAQDRALQQLEHNPAAASFLSAAAAAAAAAGQQTPGMMFDTAMHQHQGGAAAAAASSIYGQLMSANPQLAAAATALAQAHGGRNAAAAGLFQQAQAAGMQGAWNAQAGNMYQQIAAALNAGMAPSNAASAHMASGLDALMHRLGGFGGGAAGQLGAASAAAGLQQYLAAGGALGNPLMGQANQAALLQQLGSSSYPLSGRHDPHAAAAAALQMTGGCDPAALAALGLDPNMFPSPLGPGLPSQMGAADLAAINAGQQGAAGAEVVGPAAGISTLLGGAGFGAGTPAGLGGVGTPHAGAIPRRSYPGAAPGSWDTGGGDGTGMAEFGRVGDGSGQIQMGFRASTTGAGLLGTSGGVGGMGGLGPIGPSSASSAANREAVAAAVASAFGDLGQQRQYGQQQHGTEQQQQQQQAQHGLGGWCGMPGRGSVSSTGAGAASQQWPQHLTCPLTRQTMSDPVIAADGHTYERAAITDWLRLRDTSPVTGQPLSSAVLQPNYQVRQASATQRMNMQAGGGLM